MFVADIIFRDLTLDYCKLSTFDSPTNKFIFTLVSGKTIKIDKYDFESFVSSLKIRYDDILTYRLMDGTKHPIISDIAHPNLNRRVFNFINNYNDISKE
jgi:hypothetical protein